MLSPFRSENTAALHQNDCMHVSPSSASSTRKVYDLSTAFNIRRIPGASHSPRKVLFKAKCDQMTPKKPGSSHDNLVTKNGVAKLVTSPQKNLKSSAIAEASNRTVIVSLERLEGSAVTSPKTDKRLSSKGKLEETARIRVTRSTNINPVDQKVVNKGDDGALVNGGTASVPLHSDHSGSRNDGLTALGHRQDTEDRVDVLQSINKSPSLSHTKSLSLSPTVKLKRLRSRSSFDDAKLIVRDTASRMNEESREISISRPTGDENRLNSCSASLSGKDSLSNSPSVKLKRLRKIDTTMANIGVISANEEHTQVNTSGPAEEQDNKIL